MYTQLARQALTIAAADTRETIDLSSFVTAGSTGVALYFDNSTTADVNIGACHPNQTTMRYNPCRNNTAVMAYVGIDASRQVDIQISDLVNVAVYLIGEFDSDCTFLSDDVDITPASTNTWTPTDLSAQTSTAKFAIVNIVRAFSGIRVTGHRHGDSTDDLLQWDTAPNTWAIIPLNDSYECDLFRADSNTFHLVGFIDAGVERVFPFVDRSTANTATWETITPNSGTPDYLLIQYTGTYTATATIGEVRLREKTATNDADEFGKRASGTRTFLIKADSNGEIEQFIDDVAYDVAIIGQVVSGTPAEITSVDPSVRPGETLNFTHSGLGPLTERKLTDGTNEIILSGTEITGVLPAMVDGATWPFVGQVTLSLSDGTNTATALTQLNPPSGRSSVALEEGYDNGVYSYVYQYGDPPGSESPPVGTQFYYVTAESTLNPDGSWSTPSDGTTLIFAHTQSDGLIQEFPLTTGYFEGAATSTTTATGSLDVPVELSGASVSVSSASGELNSQIDLSGASASISVVNGNLVADITFDGEALSNAVSTASLTNDITLAGDASSGSNASGNLVAGDNLMGSASSSSTAQADLTASITLSGDAVMNAIAQADLSAGNNDLMGNAESNNVANANLDSEILMSGTAVSVNGATGELSFDFLLSGNALSQAVASGSLTTQVVLGGGAISEALATGDLIEGEVLRVVLNPDGVLDFATKTTGQVFPTQRLPSYFIRQGDTGPILDTVNLPLDESGQLNTDWSCRLAVLGNYGETPLLEKVIISKDEGETVFRTFVSATETEALPVGEYYVAVEVSNNEATPVFNKERHYRLSIAPQGVM